MRNWAFLGLGIILALCVFAPLITRYDPMQTDTNAQLTPPSTTHLLGTDMLGRDVWSRLLYGGRHTLFIAFLATNIALICGTFLGIVAGLAQHWIDNVLSLLMNALLAFPGLLFALVVLTLLGTGDRSLILASGFAQIIPFARLTRAAVFEVRSMPYIEAAYSLGANRWRIVADYVLPNIFPVLATYTAVTFSYCLMSSAALSFLGLSGQPGIPDWGIMLAEGRMAFRTAPWVAFAPGLVITATIWLSNRLADKTTSRH